jgi:hypothetical protein
MFNLYYHNIQQNRMQMVTITWNHCKKKNKVTPTLLEIVVLNEIYTCSKKYFWELNYGQLLYTRYERQSRRKYLRADDNGIRLLRKLNPKQFLSSFSKKKISLSSYGVMS